MSLFEASLPLPLPLPLSSSVSLNLVKNGIFSIYSQCYLLPLHLRLSPLLLSYHRSPCLVSAQKSPENNSQQKHSFTFCIYIIYNIDLSVKLKKSKRQRDCAWLCGDGVVCREWEDEDDVYHPHRMCLQFLGKKISVAQNFIQFPKYFPHPSCCFTEPLSHPAKSCVIASFHTKSFTHKNAQSIHFTFQLQDLGFSNDVCVCGFFCIPYAVYFIF